MKVKSQEVKDPIRLCHPTAPLQFKFFTEKKRYIRYEKGRPALIELGPATIKVLNYFLLGHRFEPLKRNGLKYYKVQGCHPGTDVFELPFHTVHLCIEKIRKFLELDENIDPFIQTDELGRLAWVFQPNFHLSKMEFIELQRSETIRFQKAERDKLIENSIRNDFESNYINQPKYNVENVYDHFLPTAINKEIDESTTWPSIPGIMINGKLNFGGSCEIYKARNMGSSEDVSVIYFNTVLKDERQVLQFDVLFQNMISLDHPCIAQIHTAGISLDNRPYFVMENIGEPLLQYCDRNHLGIEPRLRYFIQICSAVSHGHRAGLLHGAIQPGHIFVTEASDETLIKIIGFGMASDSDMKSTNKENLVRLTWETFQYLSPEQLDESFGQVDRRTDVYALGVLLYELVMGLLPFLIDFSQKRSFVSEIVAFHRISTCFVPISPKKAFYKMDEGSRAKVLNSRMLSETAYRKLIFGDLRWIVFKAMKKQSNLRYQNPSQLAMDIKRLLKGDKLIAKPNRISRFKRQIFSFDFPFGCFAYIAYLFFFFYLIYSLFWGR